MGCAEPYGSCQKQVPCIVTSSDCTRLGISVGEHWNVDLDRGYRYTRLRVSDPTQQR